LPKKYKSKLSKNVAYKKLQEILLRIKGWNELHSNYYEIEEVALVGSLAREGEKFGDIDICMKIKRSRDFSPVECKKKYIEYRKEVLGYAPPRGWSAELGIFELDVSRFVKNKDGRIEMLRWDQLDPICLTLRP
jgi:predicted nucleotidyltransferase